MRKVSFIILLIKFSACINTAIAQNGPPISTYKTIENIRSYIANNYKPDKAFLMDSCINTIVYLKLKIDDKKIDSVDFSINSPSQMKEALQKAILTTNTLWNPTEKEIQQLNGKTFLLPVIIY